MALSQAFGQPTLVALSIVLERHRKPYYDELGLASRTMEITRWLEFFGSMVLEAQEQSLRRIGFLVEKAKFFERYRGQLNERQEKLLLRMFREGGDGFKGGAYDLVDARAELSWTPSSDPELASYELRSTPGPDYAAEDESTVASIPPGGPLAYTSSAGFGQPGNAVSYKGYVRLTTGNEAGSDAVTVTRPL